MTIIQRIQRGAVAAALVASVGACAGNSLGNVLGSVLGGGAESGQLTGTVQGVDTRYQQITIQQSNGQSVAVNYDNSTQVVYQNQNYRPIDLEYGDRVTARIQANGNSYYTDYVQVDQSVRGAGGATSSNVQLLQGTVRQIDRTNGLFTVDVSSTSRLTVSLPYNANSSDVSRFNNLRSGDFVRFYATFLSSSRVELRQFN